MKNKNSIELLNSKFKESLGFYRYFIFVSFLKTSEQMT